MCRLTYTWVRAHRHTRGVVGAHTLIDDDLNAHTETTNAVNGTHVIQTWMNVNKWKENKINEDTIKSNWKGRKGVKHYGIFSSTLAKVGVLFSVMFVSLSVCRHDISRTAAWIRMKPSGRFGLVTSMKWLNFGIDPIVEDYSRLFYLCLSKFESSSILVCESSCLCFRYSRFKTDLQLIVKRTLVSVLQRFMFSERSCLK